MQIITVGRDPENDIVLEDKKVSAKHLALNLDDSGVVLCSGFRLNQWHIGQ